MNLPSTIAGNWQWRYHSSELTPEIEQQLRNLTETFGRGNLTNQGDN
jgi:4-alpha-glucanotransferase